MTQNPIESSIVENEPKTLYPAPPWQIWARLSPHKDVPFGLPIFEVKHSTIPNAGYGLFAINAFPAGEIVGLFHGEILHKSSKRKSKLSGKFPRESIYAMEREDGSIVDPKGGVGSKEPAFLVFTWQMILFMRMMERPRQGLPAVQTNITFL